MWSTGKMFQNDWLQLNLIEIVFMGIISIEIMRTNVVINWLYFFVQFWICNLKISRT